jgi:hypothetical protein
MPAERLAEENARLARRERLDLAPSEVLGLFVVGRLARRHGFAVSLTDTPDGGVTAVVGLQPSHLHIRPESMATAGAPPIRGTAPGTATEFTPLIAGTAMRTAPGSAQPFDAQVLNRATRTLEAGRSWNAFTPVRTAPAALEAAPSDYGPAHEEQPAYEPQPYDYAPPDQGHALRAASGPVAGRFPGTEAPIVVEGPIVSGPPAGAVQLPRQRTGDSRRNGDGPGTLRRRVPGGQLPAESAPKPPTAPPTADDAVAARDLVEAFEAGVSRAQWDVIEADMAAPPAAGHQPLARRVPGASLPVSGPANPTPPAAPAKPMDPDEARDLIEQFEYGVALALNEVRPQHEGQSR